MLRPLLFAFALTLLIAHIAEAAIPPKPSLKAAINTTALQPGQQAVAAVVLDIPDGFHAQSHTPTQPTLIPYEASLKPKDRITIHGPIYPPAKIETYPALGELSVYTGQVMVYIPFQVQADAPIGPLELKGTVSYQICNDRVCFRPEEQTFLIETKVVPATESVQPNQPELFRDFDYSVFARLSSSAATTTPAAVGTEVSFFGRRFNLAADAYLLAFPIAFFVGIIFNLMPCVLPVVPLKAMSFFEVAQHNRAKSMLLGAVFSLGLVASFAALALLVVVFRKLTWGQQFSNPWFVAGITLILLLMAISMFGGFTILLPSSAYRFTPRHDTYTGNFLFGIFTAILSTPCTAPMFVALLIWAAQQPAPVGVGLVMTVGVGMAFPYFILSAFPALARRFPRTGPWAELIKQMMGFLVLATAVYFAGGYLIEGRRFFWLVFAIIAAACVFLIIRTLQLTRRLLPGIASIMVALLLLSGSLAATLRLTREPIKWQPYSAVAFDQARASGKIVVVEFTANWCFNCLTLEATVLNDPKVAKAFAGHDVIPLKADLTDQNAPGWELLGKLSVAGGIPLTAIYPPNKSEPIQLSSMYSVQTLMSALESAADGRVALIP